MRKESKKKTDKLAGLYTETNDLLANMERSAIAGLRKETHKTSLRKGEVGKKEVEK